MADAALADANKERSEIQARFAAAEQACQSKFFATSCIEHAKEHRREALMRLRAVEIEAHTFKRQIRVTERDQALASKPPKEDSRREQAEHRKADRPTNGKSPAENAQEEKAVEPGRKLQTTIFSDRAARHEEKLKEIRAEEAANAKKRAENVAAYERKVAEAKEHQKQVEAKKAEKEEKRRSKQASQPAQQ
ncbi:hypothetical protein [Noviherbaspirillum sp.]|uniref:hypothetical protein n=1 Tax=Noviherbaspirillum sp. TaxID=1926288 RepID=UPI002B488EC0|nr:hypothetical protein [Noviherbaspirillum sp.]HJV81523.1 hypothetical protein [Noviherbaspirillum sp.]